MSPRIRDLATQTWTIFRELGVTLLKISLAWAVVSGLGLFLLAPLLGWGPFAGPPSFDGYTLAGFSIGRRAFRFLYGGMLVLSVTGFFLAGLTAAVAGIGTDEDRRVAPLGDPVLCALLACGTAIIVSYVVALVTLT